MNNFLRKDIVIPNHVWLLRWVEKLAGGFKPSEKYSSNWIISPRFGVKMKNPWNHLPKVSKLTELCSSFCGYQLGFTEVWQKNDGIFEARRCIFLPTIIWYPKLSFFFGGGAENWVVGRGFFPFGAFRPIFRRELLLVLWRVYSSLQGKSTRVRRPQYCDTSLVPINGNLHICTYIILGWLTIPAQKIKNHPQVWKKRKTTSTWPHPPTSSPPKKHMPNHSKRMS